MEFSPALSPSDFFSLSLPLAYGNSWRGKHLLPDRSAFFPEECFAEVGLAWNEEGIIAGAEVDLPLESPDGDFLELFFDTRDIKGAGFPTRFCHHFLVVPEQGASREVTRFRTEESHPLCASSDLEVVFKSKKAQYLIEVFIPAHCLYGYDPEAFDRLGFTYRLNRSRGGAQHFALSSSSFAIEQHPSLWASLRLDSGPSRGSSRSKEGSGRGVNARE